ncbi:MAG: endonuclease [Gammaproteobacteria bacterium]
MIGTLGDAYGVQDWWPGQTPFEVCVGAILVQNTNWNNAARAIEALRGSDLLRPHNLVAAPVSKLEALVRPAGCYRQKARRVRGFSRWWMDAGEMPGLQSQETEILRAALLALPGIGPETADCILLYALGRPVFIVDAYTRRLLSRLGIAEVGARRRGYEMLRQRVEVLAGPDAALLGELHAWIVEHGKQRCGARPRCDGCPLGGDCTYPATGLIGRQTRNH